jgi:hypothetical protein
LIGRVEFRDGFNPAQRFLFVASIEAVYLGGNALSDGRQSRVRHHKAQFPQPSPTPPLTHHFHPFGGRGHFDLPASPNTATVTRYGPYGNGP